MLPKYPIYVPTKGRWRTPYTLRALTKIKAPFKAVVEPQEADEYAAIVGEDNLLILPHSDKGLVVTRNWIWDHAQESSVERFWTMDDNITAFLRMSNNMEYYLTTPTFFKVIEDFLERYENVPIAGMNYEMFVKRKEIVPPFYLNTRVYSNMLIQTDVQDSSGKPYRNEGFFNDDTDLCLRILKDGFCTILFNAFLINKLTTMTIKGGMTPYYQDDGRWKMANELRKRHPDVVRITRKFRRWQHHVDYRPFRKNKLIKKEGIESSKGIDNYGMVLKRDRNS